MHPGTAEYASFQGTRGTFSKSSIMYWAKVILNQLQRIEVI
jgi:hypothetical protein